MTGTTPSSANLSDVHELQGMHRDLAQCDLDTLPPGSSTDDQESPYGKDLPSIQWPADDRASLLETVFAGVSDVVFVFDRAGKLLDVNPAGCALASANRPEELRGQFVDRWIADEHRKAFHEALKTLALGRKTSLRFDFVNRAGQRRGLSARLLPLRTADGLAGFVAICQDMSEILQWESVVRQKQKMEMVGRVASEIVHDFNNLLTVINGFSEIALQNVEESNPLFQMLTDIHHAGDKAANLSRQFLAMSRRQPAEVKAVDLRVLVVDMEKILRRLLGKNVELQFRPESSLSIIRADVGQIEQALLNLAVNARDAMPLGGRLTITLRCVPGIEVPVTSGIAATAPAYVLLSVRDTGCGMDAETKKRIFEPFFTTKGPGQGLGLGLATVAKAVEQNDGLIEVLTDLGRGTTFNLYFPRAEG